MKAISSLHERFPVLAARGALTHSVSYGPRFFIAGFLTVAAKWSRSQGSTASDQCEEAPYAVLLCLATAVRSTERDG